MIRKIPKLLALPMLILLACGACKKGQELTTIGNPSGESQPLGDAASLTTFGGAQVTEDFAESGQFLVNFVAEDAGGNALFASETPRGGLIPVAYAADGDLNCSITTPVGSTCTLVSVDSTETAADTRLAIGILIDSSAADADFDPTGVRQAASASLCSPLSVHNPENYYGIFDATSDYAAVGLAAEIGPAVREIIPLRRFDQENPGALCGEVAVLESCETPEDGTLDDNCLLLARGTFPRNKALADLCEDTATNEDLDGLKQAIVVLAMSNDNGGSVVTIDEIVACFKDNSITVHTVGFINQNFFAAGLDLTPIRAAIEENLIQISRETGGIHSFVSDPALLDNVFEDLVKVDTEGKNTATFVIKPIPASTTVTGILSIEGTNAQAAISLTVP